MRRMKWVFSLAFLVVLAGAVSAADRDTRPLPGNEQPTEQTATITGVVAMPSNEAPKNCTAELKVSASRGAVKNDEVTYFLFADGNNAKKLKELASRGQTATITGVAAKEGYRVTNISK